MRNFSRVILCYTIFRSRIIWPGSWPTTLYCAALSLNFWPFSIKSSTAESICSYVKKYNFRKPIFDWRSRPKCRLELHRKRLPSESTDATRKLRRSCRISTIPLTLSWKAEAAVMTNWWSSMRPRHCWKRLSAVMSNTLKLFSVMLLSAAA